MQTHSRSRGARRPFAKHALLLLLVFGLSVTSNSVHAQLPLTDTYEPGVEGEIWRFIGSYGRSYSAACAAANYDANTDCPFPPQDDELWWPIAFDIFDAGPLGDYRVFVADRSNSRVVVYDYAGDHVASLGAFVGRNGAIDSFSVPEGLAVDAARNLVVADTLNERLVVFDSGLNYKFEVSFGKDVLPALVALAPHATIVGPPGDCAAPGRPVVALTTWSRVDVLGDAEQDVTDKNQVLLFDANMCRVGELGQPHAVSPAPAGGNFFLPGVATFGPSGEIYVGAYQENKVEVFWPDAASPSGYTRALGVNTGQPDSTITDHNGQVVAFAGPYGVMTDARGRLVIGDTNNSRMLVLLQPWHPENTSPRHPMNRAIGTRWQYAFELVAGGAFAGSWLSVVREDRYGRWIGSSVVHDLLYTFELPELAITQVTAAEVATGTGDVLRVRANVVVPVSKSALTNVIPTVGVDSLLPQAGRASLGPAAGAFLAAPGADVFAPGYEGTPIAAIGELQPGHYAQVYWDFPVHSDGHVKFWVSARKVTGSTDDIIADPKTVDAETVVGTCAAPQLHAPVFARTPIPVLDANTGMLTDVYPNQLHLTLAASAGAGVREVQYQHLEGPLNRTGGTLPGASSELLIDVPFESSLLWTVQYRAVSTCGARSAWTTTRFKVDSRPPRLGFGPVSPPATGIDPDGRRWHSAPLVTMQVKASDDDTFSSNVLFPDFPASINGSLTLQFSEERSGQHRYVRVQDPLANEFGEWSHVFRWINIDRTAPTLTVQPTLMPNANNWYRTDVGFAAVADEAPGASGVKTLTSPQGFTIASGATRDHMSGVTSRQGEGVNLTVTVVAEDYAGNSLAVVSNGVNIDRTAPVPRTETDPSRVYTSHVLVTLAAADLPGTAGAVSSGVAKIRYAVGGGPVQDYAAPILINTLGTTSIEFWAVDRADNVSARQRVFYTVSAAPLNHAPACGSAVVAPGLIWPANSREVSLAISGVVDPDGDAVRMVVDRILQDEPTTTAGDGNTIIDAGGIGTSTPWVRAERISAQSDRTYSNGRLYEIFFSASDGRGGSCQGTIVVGVPHNQRPGNAIIDNGCRWDSVTGAMVSCAAGAQLPIAPTRNN